MSRRRDSRRGAAQTDLRINTFVYPAADDRLNQN